LEKDKSPVHLYKNIATDILTFYGFKEQPFSSSPNPRFLYITEQHQSILAKLTYAITERQGLSLVIGDSGAGKTTIARHLHDTYRDSTENYVVYITNPQYPSPFQLLKAICNEFEIESKRSRQQQIEALQNQLTDYYSENKNVILIIDEGQLLVGPQFELIRLMLNFETNKDKLLQIIIFAQTEIRAKLRQKKAVQSRIVTTSTLNSFDFNELKELINYRMGVSGLKGTIFTEDAYKEIYDYSKGTPRTAVLLCYNSLPYGYIEGLKSIDKDIILTVETNDMYAG
jgi:general secretion pathway protein A